MVRVGACMQRSEVSVSGGFYCSGPYVLRICFSLELKLTEAHSWPRLLSECQGPPVSAFGALGLHMCTFTAGVSCGCWGSIVLIVYEVLYPLCPFPTPFQTINDSTNIGLNNL